LYHWQAKSQGWQNLQLNLQPLEITWRELALFTRRSLLLAWGLVCEHLPEPKRYHLLVYQVSIAIATDKNAFGGCWGHYKGNVPHCTHGTQESRQVCLACTNPAYVFVTRHNIWQTSAHTASTSAAAHHIVSSLEGVPCKYSQRDNLMS